VIIIFKPDLLCIQETKVERVENTLIRNALGAEYENDFVALLAQGTRGGIILAANNAFMKLSSPDLTCHSVSTYVHDSRCATIWKIVGVYDP
jgi:hypothetical protein